MHLHSVGIHRISRIRLATDTHQQSMLRLAIERRRVCSLKLFKTWKISDVDGASARPADERPRDLPVWCSDVVCSIHVSVLERRPDYFPGHHLNCVVTRPTRARCDCQPVKQMYWCREARI